MGSFIGYRPVWSRAGLGTERGGVSQSAPSPAPRVDGWRSALGRRVFSQGSLLTCTACLATACFWSGPAWPQSALAASTPHPKQAVGCHSVFWRRTSSHFGPRARNRQWGGKARQQHSSHEPLSTASRVVQPRGQSVQLFLSVLVHWWVLVVVG